MQGSFDNHTLDLYRELADHFSDPQERYDFTRCVRSDGSAYGTKGNCKKGLEGKKQYPFKAAVTQGRFNIPHSGHAKLIKDMLQKAPIVHVVMGKGKENVDTDLRSQMLRAVLRDEGVDLSRVKITKGTAATRVLSDLAEKFGKEKVLFTLGADQEKFLNSVGRSLGVQTSTVARDSSGASSSAIRKIIDSGDIEGLGKEFKKNPYLSRLANVARKVEKGNFSENDEFQDFTRCERPNGTTYGTAGQCRKGTRVALNNPNKPLPSGSTPLEKASRKLESFKSKIDNPSYSPTVKQLEQFGALSLAVDGLKNLKDRGEPPTISSAGQELRKLLPKEEDRRTFARAKGLLNLKNKKEDLEQVAERRLEDISNTLKDLNQIHESLSKRTLLGGAGRKKLASDVKRVSGELEEVRKRYTEMISQFRKPPLYKNILAAEGKLKAAGGWREQRKPEIDKLLKLVKKAVDQEYGDYLKTGKVRDTYLDMFRKMTGDSRGRLSFDGFGSRRAEDLRMDMKHLIEMYEKGKL